MTFGLKEGRKGKRGRTQPAAGLDEVLEGCGALGVLGAAAEGDAEGREDGALTACATAAAEEERRASIVRGPRRGMGR